MNENRKEQIIMAALRLSAQKGLGAVSMNMIAEEIGIKKPSLYNHFASKEELIEEMYNFLRQIAFEQSAPQLVPLSKLSACADACEILQSMVGNYIKMNCQKEIEMFYKVIYSERTISPAAAKIMVEETEKMIGATKQLFIELQNRKLLHFEDLETDAASFAITIHGFMDYEADKCFSNGDNINRDDTLIKAYISNFCKAHTFKE